MATYIANKHNKFYKGLADPSISVPDYFIFLAFSMTQALWAFGGAIGSILGGISGVRFGRKNTLLLNNLFIISGIVLQVSSISIDSVF